MIRIFIFLAFSIILVACSSSKSAQTETIESKPNNNIELVSEEGPIHIYRDQSSDLFTIKRDDLQREYPDLYFVKRYFRYYQALNKEMEVIYFDDSLNVFNEAEDFYWTCGTVPHYSLTIAIEEDDFVVLSDETFFDMEGKEGPVEIKRISTSIADSVLFINGQTRFNYTSNFNVAQEIQLDPQTLVLKKGDKYFFEDNPASKYDQVLFSEFSPSLKTMRNGLYGLHAIIEPQFNEIGEFTYYLAPVVLSNGEKAMIDAFGMVY